MTRSIRSWVEGHARNHFWPKALTSLISIAGILILTQFLFHLFPSWKEDAGSELPVRLEGKWDLGLAPEGWTGTPRDLIKQPLQYDSVQVPGDLPTPAKAKFHGWMVYRRVFDAPDACRTDTANCVLVMGEVGDSVEGYLNGRFLKRAGDFPPHYHYIKHYPVSMPLPREELRANSNELVLIVYAPRRAQIGIRRGPVEILSGRTAFLFVELWIAKNVAVPLMSAVALFLLALVGYFFALASPKSESLLHAFVRYCFCAAVFLVNFSEIPREYLPLGFASYFHFSSRLLMDWALFELVRAQFVYPKWTTWVFRPVYALVLGVLAAQFFWLGSGTDSAYATMSAAFPLLILPVAMGLSGALFTDRPHRKFLVVVFALLFPMQISDILVFHQFYSFAYFVKFYPLVNGLAFAWVVLDRGQKELRETSVLLRETQQLEEFRKQTSQLAHDIRSPLLALDAVTRLAHQSLPENQRSLLRNAVSRIQHICFQLVSYSKGEASGLIGGKTFQPRIWPQPLCALIEPVLLEKGLQLKKAHSIHWKPTEAHYSYFCEVPPQEFTRVLSNLIDNALDALGDAGAVEITVSADKKQLRVDVSDNGKGIVPELLPKVAEYGFTEGKEGGSGLGLYHARKSVESWRGELQIESSVGRGTKVSLLLPRVEQPNWCICSLTLPRQGTVLIVDDEDLIHSTWDLRLIPYALKTVHLKSPEELQDWLHQNRAGLDEPWTLLLDCSFVGSPKTGLNLIEDLDLRHQAILVTAQFDHPSIVQACKDKAIRLLPKPWVASIPITVG